jgi:hypothetical protein
MNEREAVSFLKKCSSKNYLEKEKIESAISQIKDEGEQKKIISHPCPVRP